MKVYLAGEGSDELGEWFKPAQYRDLPGDPGILEALLSKLAATGFEIQDATPWSSIRKYQVGRHLRAEMRNVLGAAVQALDADCEAFVFVRDRDTDEEREAHVEEGLRQAQETFPTLRICGGVAIHEIEAWILALNGERGSERHRRPKEYLRDTHGIRMRSEKVAVIDGSTLEQVPSDARSLLTWLGRARSLFHTEG